MIARQWKGFSMVAVACAVVGLGALAGCGSDNEVSAASLKPRLLPVSLVPGFRLLRTLDWSDPVNLVGEGIFLPEATHPSQAVKEGNDSGFRGSGGEDVH